MTVVGRGPIDRAISLAKTEVVKVVAPGSGLLLLVVALSCSVACTATTSQAPAPAKPQEATTSVTQASIPASAPCAVKIVDLDASSIGPGGTYEVIGAIDLTKPAPPGEPIGLTQRIVHRACAMKADAAGVLAIGTMSGVEYVAVKKRASSQKNGASSVPPSPATTVDYFPTPKDDAAKRVAP
jgi:hypothetical protein